MADYKTERKSEDLNFLQKLSRYCIKITMFSLFFIVPIVDNFYYVDKLLGTCLWIFVVSIFIWNSPTCIFRALDLDIESDYLVKENITITISMGDSISVADDNNTVPLYSKRVNYAATLSYLRK